MQYALNNSNRPTQQLNLLFLFSNSQVNYLFFILNYFDDFLYYISKL